MVMFMLFSECLLFSGQFWGDRGNQRKFFEDFAAANKFDPLIPDNWYTEAAATIQARIFEHVSEVANNV